MSSIASRSNQRPRLRMSVLTLFIFMAVPLLWLAISLLFIDPAQPPLPDAEIQAKAQYLWDNPQPTTRFIEHIYSYPYSDQICIDLKMATAAVRVEVNDRNVFTGLPIQGSASDRDPGFSYQTTKHVCLKAPQEKTLSSIRVTTFGYLVIGFETYEWAFKPDVNE